LWCIVPARPGCGVGLGDDAAEVLVAPGDVPVPVPERAVVAADEEPQDVAVHYGCGGAVDTAAADADALPGSHAVVVVVLP